MDDQRLAIHRHRVQRQSTSLIANERRALKEAGENYNCRRNNRHKLTCKGNPSESLVKVTVAYPTLVESKVLSDKEKHHEVPLDFPVRVTDAVGDVRLFKVEFHYTFR